MIQFNFVAYKVISIPSSSIEIDGSVSSTKYKSRLDEIVSYCLSFFSSLLEASEDSTNPINRSRSDSDVSKNSVDSGLGGSGDESNVGSDLVLDVYWETYKFSEDIKRLMFLFIFEEAFEKVSDNDDCNLHRLKPNFVQHKFSQLLLAAEMLRYSQDGSEILYEHNNDRVAIVALLRYTALTKSTLEDRERQRREDKGFSDFACSSESDSESEDVPSTEGVQERKKKKDDPPSSSNKPSALDTQLGSPASKKDSKGRILRQQPVK